MTTRARREKTDGVPRVSRRISDERRSDFAEVAGTEWKKATRARRGLKSDMDSRSKKNFARCSATGVAAPSRRARANSARRVAPGERSNPRRPRRRSIPLPHPRAIRAASPLGRCVTPPTRCRFPLSVSDGRAMMARKSARPARGAPRASARHPARPAPRPPSRRRRGALARRPDARAPRGDPRRRPSRRVASRHRRLGAPGEGRGRGKYQRSSRAPPPLRARFFHHPPTSAPETARSSRTTTSSTSPSASARPGACSGGTTSSPPTPPGSRGEARRTSRRRRRSSGPTSSKRRWR